MPEVEYTKDNILRWWADLESKDGTAKAMAAYYLGIRWRDAIGFLLRRRVPIITLPSESYATGGELVPVYYPPTCDTIPDERTAIVAWLRGQAEIGDNALLNAIEGSQLRRDLAAGVVAINRAADAIERGDHLKEG